MNRVPVLRLVNRIARSPLTIPRKLVAALRDREKRRRCVASSEARLAPTARINNARPRDAMRIGSGTHILGTLQTLAHGGSITIGCNSYIGENSYIWSSEGIEIGDRVLISHGVNIHDNISHPISAKQRNDHFLAMVSGKDLSHLEGVTSAPVKIGNDVWIGFNATILKGVTIGDGAVIGACSLITHDVPSFAIMAGNPARRIGTAEP
jgi:acetyltransferase-like isoleucine patch superfamily enzyme